MATNKDYQQARRERLTAAARKVGYGTIDQFCQAILADKITVTSKEIDPTYPPIKTIRPTWFKSEDDYKKAYSECNERYPFKARIDGGWTFYAFENDYLSRKNQ